MKTSLSKVNRDRVFNNVAQTSSQKVPRYPNLMSAPENTPGLQGDIFSNRQ